MELPVIKIEYVITHPDGTEQAKGTFNFTDMAARRACAERFNKCVLDGFTVTTRRVK